jgi:hypothetical protein
MLFGTAPVPAVTWVLMLGAACAMVVLEETRKAIVRWGTGGASPGPGPGRPPAPTGL